MRVVKPSYEIITNIRGKEFLTTLEYIGRVCYKSEERISPESAPKFIKGILKSGHESVIEHVNLTIKFICDRGISHEIVRHRIASYSQESTRYCNYGKANEVTFIKPFFFIEDSPNYNYWELAMAECEHQYLALIKNGARLQEARSVLPNSLKTEIVCTMNLRSWRHFFKLRTHKTAHPQMRELVIPLLLDLKGKIPIIFDDIEEDKLFTTETK